MLLFMSNTFQCLESEQSYENNYFLCPLQIMTHPSTTTSSSSSPTSLSFLSYWGSQKVAADTSTCFLHHLHHSCMYSTWVEGRMTKLLLMIVLSNNVILIVLLLDHQLRVIKARNLVLSFNKTRRPSQKNIKTQNLLGKKSEETDLNREMIPFLTTSQFLTFDVLLPGSDELVGFLARMGKCIKCIKCWLVRCGMPSNAYIFSR